MDLGQIYIIRGMYTVYTVDVCKMHTDICDIQWRNTKYVCHGRTKICAYDPNASWIVLAQE